LVSVLDRRSKKSKLVSVLCFFAEGEGELPESASIFPLYVADANVSDCDKRSKKPWRSDDEFLGLFFAVFPFWEFPFMEELAYVSSFDRRSKKSLSALPPPLLLRELPPVPFILALANVSSFAMRMKNEFVVFPEERGVGSASIFPFILADAYVSCDANRLNSDVDTGAVLVVIWDVDVRVVYLDAPLLLEQTELDAFIW